MLSYFPISKQLIISAYVQRIAVGIISACYFLPFELAAQLFIKIKQNCRQLSNI